MGPKIVAATVAHSSLGVHEPASAAEGRGGAKRRAGGETPAVSPPAPAAAGAAAPLDFETVYEQHFDFVWRSLRLLGVAPEAAEDAVQDTFSVVSRRLPHFEGRSALRTWLFAILERIAANHRRMVKRKLRQLEPLPEAVVGREPTPHAHAEAAEAIDLIQTFCDTLDSDRRALFVLSLLEETPAPEVAQALGIPLNTVYSRVRSLREGLRRALETREVEHD
jgi:RNA polymerase sigma-70 factor (ECF subfamily)